MEKFILLIACIWLSFSINGQDTLYISQQPQNQDKYLGDSAIFQVSVISGNPASFQWQKDEIDIPNSDDSTLVIYPVQLLDSGEYRCIAYNNLGTDTSASAVLSFLSGQIINIPQGWSGISSFTSLADDTITNLFSPIIDDLTILMDGGTGMYWPDQGVNSLVYWETFEGYKIHVMNETQLLFSGPIETNNLLTLNGGWSIIPVISPNYYPVADIYNHLGDTLTLIKEISGIKLFWPDQGITSLEHLIPGKAYQIHVSHDCDFSFSGWICGDYLVDPRDGQRYRTTQIGDQCWMAEDLNIGTRIDGVNEQMDNDTIEKYCYNDDPANCGIYGGLYQWDEGMQYVLDTGAQGICPSGWHIPTDDDWKILEGTVDSQYGVGDPIWNTGGYRGFDAGYHLKSTTGWHQNGNGDDSYGFKALPGGSRYTDGSFGSLGSSDYFWSSTEWWWGPYSWRRHLHHNYNTIYRSDNERTTGYSIRCLKDD